MKKITKILRLAVAIMIILVSFGIGIGGAILPGHRGKYQNKEVVIELVESKETEEDDQETVDQEKKG